MDSGSDMDVYEDAVEDHSANHAGVITTISPIPPNQSPPANHAGVMTTISPTPPNQSPPENTDSTPVRIGSPSTSQRMSLHHAREEFEPPTKRMLVEKDDSVSLRTQVNELKDIARIRIRREKDRARTQVEEVEERARERDEQWKKYFADSSLKARIEAEKRLEDRDLVWENRLQSQLREQAEKQERSRAQLERTMIEGTAVEIRRLEEQMATTQVENERTIAKMLQKENTQRRQLNASQHGVSTTLQHFMSPQPSMTPQPFMSPQPSMTPQPSTGPLESSTATLVPSNPSLAGPSATTTPSSSSAVNPVAHTTSGFSPVASRTTNILDQVANMRRGHTRTNIRTKLVLKETTSSRVQSQAPEAPLPSVNLEGLSDSQRAAALVFAPMIPALVNQAVEETLQKIKAPPVSPARASRKKIPKSEVVETKEERSTFLALIRTYFHEILLYTENAQIELHDPPGRDIIGLFMASKHVGPDLDDLHLDFAGGVGSDWNKRAFYLLRKGFCQKLEGYDGVPPRSDDYYHGLIVDQFERLAKIWRKAQAQTRTVNGVQITENGLMTEKRMNAEREKSWKIKRHNTRRHNLYNRRRNIVQFMIRANGDDCHIWEWLGSLLQQLGANGMSSEDTDIGISKKYRVKVLAWRRDMDDYLDLIDRQRLKGVGYGPAGSTPNMRLRYGKRVESTREAVSALPESLYNQEWLESTDQGYRELTLSVSRKEFEWLSFYSDQMD